MADHEPERYAGPYDDPWRYALWGQAGGGAEGRVWRATRALSDGAHLDVAVKVLDPNRFGGIETPDQVAQKWSDQAARLRSLKSTGVVPVQEAFVGAPPHRREPGFDTEPATPYFVMGWVEGQDLATWTSMHPGGLERLAVLEAAADGLDEVHATGQAHADVKPSNLIVTTRRLANGQTFDSAVLVDFGLMRTVTGQAPSKIAGSPSYWAPELFRGGSYSPASDLYGFAGVVVYLLTNRPPPEIGDVQGEVRRVLAEANIGPTAIDAIVAALAPEPEARPTAGVRAWLTSVRSGFSSAAPTVVDRTVIGTAIAPLPVGARRGRAKLIAAMVALVALLAAGLAFVLTRGGGGNKGLAAVTATTLAPTSSTAPASSTTTSTTTTELTTTTTVAASTTASPVVPTVPPQAFLSDFSVVESTSGAGPIDGPVKISGTTYLHGVLIVNAYCRETVYIDYDLSRSYTTLTSKVGLPDTGRSDSPMILAVYIDGKQVFQGQFALGAVRNLTLPVSGALRLRFEMTRINKSFCSQVALGDPQLSP